MRVIILGGTGSLSSRIAEKSLERGHEVAIVSRGQRKLSGLERALHWIADRAALEEIGDRMEAFRPDVVVDSICFSADRAADLVRLFGRVRRVVLISSVDVYGEEVGAMPVSEGRVPQPVTPYAKAKLASEQVVLGGLGRSATVFRPSHILGRTFLTASLWGRTGCWVDRMARGKAVPAIDGGRNLVTPVHALDAAEWIVRSFDCPQADGEIFNAVGSEIIAQERYLASIAQAVAQPLEVLPVAGAVFAQWFDAARQFRFHRPYSSTKAETVFGYRAQSSVETMMKETVDYMLEAGLVRPSAEQARDDELVELLRSQQQGLERLFGSDSFAAAKFLRKPLGVSQ